VKRLIDTRALPPGKQDHAIETTLGQAELLCLDLAA
jgi:hypothetical protein